MVHIAEHSVHSGYSDLIDYIFESGAAHVGEARKFFAEMQKDENIRKKCLLGSFGHAAKKDNLPIQSADPLAYLQRRRYAGQQRSGEMTLERLLQAVPTISTKMFDDGRMKGSVHDFIEKQSESTRRRILDSSTDLKVAFPDLYPG